MHNQANVMVHWAGHHHPSAFQRRLSSGWRLKTLCCKADTRLTNERNRATLIFLLVLSISWTFETPSCFSNYNDLYSKKLLLLSMPSWYSFASQKFVQVKCVEVRFPHLTRNTWSLAITQRIVAVWSTRSLYAKCQRINLNFLNVLRWAFNLLGHRPAG